MPEFVAILVPLIITILGNVLVAWVEVRGKSKLKWQSKRFLTWLLIVFSTLIVPTLILTWVITQVAARLLVNLSVDLPNFVLLVAFSVGTVGSLWPLGWGVLLYPVFDALLDQLYPIADTTDNQTQEEKESPANGGKES